MKGLFIKDIRCIWKVVVACIASMLLIVLSVNTMVENMDIDVISKAIICVYLIVICGSLVSATMIAEDEKSKFDIYTFVLPIDKRLVTLEKFIMSFGIVMLYTIVGLITISIISDKPQEHTWYIIYLAAPVALILIGMQIVISKFFGMASALVSTIVTSSILLVILFAVSLLIYAFYDIDIFVYQCREIFFIIGIILYVVFALIACNVREEC